MQQVMRLIHTRLIQHDRSKPSTQLGAKELVRVHAHAHVLNHITYVVKKCISVHAHLCAKAIQVHFAGTTI